ncbi:hypothetical protein D3C87_2019740 [compost metagenome]
MQDAKQTLKAAMGKVLKRGDTRVLATFHPSFALRSPSHESRDAAYQAIVQALARARRLADRPDANP